jgi:UDP-glucuronate decarboxylase
MKIVLERQINEIINRRPEIWSDISGKKIFITGGTGFSGRWLLESLILAQDMFDFSVELTVLSRDPQSFIDKVPHIGAHRSIKFVQGDITSFALPDQKFHYILHGAATSAKETYDGEDPLNKFDMASHGARRVLDLAVKSQVDRMLLVGSGSVYGGLHPGIDAISENYHGAPLTFDTEAGLGHGKRAAEFQAACYADRYGLSLSVARCFTFVGAYLPLNIHYAIGNFIRDAMNSETIDVQGDGSAVRSYMFAGDLVTWLIVLMVQGKSRTIYNVGSDEGVAIGDLAKIVREVIAPHKEVRILGKSSGHLRSQYLPDITVARREHKLDVWTDLRGAIERTAAVAHEERWND